MNALSSMEKTGRFVHSLSRSLRSCSAATLSRDDGHFPVSFDVDYLASLVKSRVHDHRWYGSHISRSSSRSGPEGKKRKKSKTKAKHTPRVAPSKGTAAQEENVTFVHDKRTNSLPSIPLVGIDSQSAGNMAGEQDGLSRYIYKGPFSSAVKKVKHLSLFSCFLTLSSCPVMMFLDPASLVEGAAATSMTARLSLAGTLSTFGLATTGLLHWFTYPYVHHMEFDGKNIDIETANFLAKKQTYRVPLNKVEAGAPGSMHPLSTFRASGRVFYVDREYVTDKELLSLLEGSTVEENTHPSHHENAP